ncbi:hypothetical protein KKG46_01865 [Patescibacteria group bacterium]|nr:hypothetical protein [Patescibacteria group bacterium]
MSLSNSKIQPNILILIPIIIAFGIVMRLLPHSPNFTPIGAIALWSGLYLPKRYAFIVAISAMLFSDIILGFYSLSIMTSVYISWIIMTSLGVISKNKAHAVLSIFAGSIFFFLITNFAVWIFGSLYPVTFDGLLTSYVNALPFFRNSLSANLIYGLSLIAITEYSTQLSFAIKTNLITKSALSPKTE